MYALKHDGKAEDTDAYNRALEEQEIAHIKTGPDRLMLYVRMDVEYSYSIITWMGTVLSQGSNVSVGPRVQAGFQSYYKGGTYRRAVSCRLFGILYHGWYMESSGDYVRLKRAKRQGHV